MYIMDEIEKLMNKRKKNEVVVVVWDIDGCGNIEDYVTANVKKTDRHDELIYLDYCDMTHVVEIEQFDEIKRVMLLKKNYLSKMSKSDLSKKPQNMARHVGIELEFISKLSRPEIVMLMSEAGVEEHVSVKDDGSIDTTDSYEFSHEIAILAKETEFETVIKKITKALKDNSTVNTSCGMHVHLDMRTRNPDMSYASLFQAQPVLYAMNPSSRFEGTYSRPEIEYKQFVSSVDSDRYLGINKSAYLTHNTLEIRMHAGTLSADKINNWTKLLIKIADQPCNFKYVSMCREVIQFKKRFKVRGKLAKYVDMRIASFKMKQNGSPVALVA